MARRPAPISTGNAETPGAQIRHWRRQLQAERAALKKRFDADGNTARLLKQHSHLVDTLLRQLWRSHSMPPQSALIAVGGYGRGELFPHSDIDLLVLLPEQSSFTDNSAIEALVGVLWDVGLTVGHSVRTPRECVLAASQDVTIQTNLLEARHVCGSRARYLQLRALIGATIRPAEFYRAKVQEQRQRHARFDDTAYNLEPNVKESPGGLRDLQTILWIARSLGLGKDWKALVTHGLITPAEARQLRRHERHLQTLRVHLHYLARRHEDRLVFDFQNALARQLGFIDTARRRASEQLMHGFYSSAKFIGLMNDILLPLLQSYGDPIDAPATSINERFDARRDLLEIRSADLLTRQPATIFESYLLLEQHPELKGMSPGLSRALHRAQTRVDGAFRRCPAHQQLFMQILRQPVGVTHALRLMNRHGILGRYIPAFGRIVGQMQHDLFHVYTVDEHILNVLRNLRHFALPEFRHEFPLCSKLFSDFDAPHLLYLGALFHDIAKGRGGDHSLLGTRDARSFCRRHALPPADTELVAWLVRSHLVMSSVAQKSDLTDPKVIEQFTRFVADERRLTALYLLTVADIRGTSPKVWNNWKAQLLENLFFAARRGLRGDAADVDGEIETRQAHARERLEYYGIMPDSYRALWGMWGRPYFLRFEAQEIAWHTRLLLSHANTAAVIVRARLLPVGYGIQVMIYTADRDDLFARICRFFERAGYSIVEARIHTTLHGYAIDNFTVIYQYDKTTSYRDLLNYIEYELALRLEQQGPLEAPLQGRISRQVKHMPIPTTISLHQDENSDKHIIDVVASDRPGLLSRLAGMLLKHGVHLHNAKINTLGSRVEDTFVVSGRGGTRLSAAKLKKLQEDIVSTI